MRIEANIDLAKLTAGDKETWDRFVGRFSPVIYAAVGKTLRKSIPRIGQEDVEDVAQAVFFRLVRRDFRLLKKYDPSRASMVTWLTIISRSGAIDWLRKRKPPTISLDEHEMDVPAPPAPRREAEIELPPGLLTGRQELILKLIFEKGLNSGEIADILRINPQTVRSTKHKAITKLRKFFRGDNRPGMYV